MGALAVVTMGSSVVTKVVVIGEPVVVVVAGILGRVANGLKSSCSSEEVSVVPFSFLGTSETTALKPLLMVWMPKGLILTPV